MQQVPDDGRAGPAVGGGASGAGPERVPLSPHLARQAGGRPARQHYAQAALQPSRRYQVRI